MVVAGLLMRGFRLRQEIDPSFAGCPGRYRSGEHSCCLLYTFLDLYVGLIGWAFGPARPVRGDAPQTWVRRCD